MGTIVWTKEQLAILDNEYAIADLKELAERLERTPAAIKTRALMRKLKRSPETRFWNSERRERLIALYPNHTNEDIAKLLGCSPSSIAGMAFKLRLFKDKEFIIRCASKTFFPKGHKPLNKGLKQTEYMSETQIEKTKATRFQKGNISKRHKQVGYEYVNVYGYIEIKTAEPNVFELKHRVIWMKHNGNIPPGYNVQFKDGNKQNVCVENLYLISRSQQMKTENSMYARYPKEIQRLITLKAILNRAIRRQQKKNEHE